MATRTWISGTAKNWTDTTAWSGSAVPAAGDDVVFNASAVGNCTLTAAATNTIRSLDMTGYTGTFTFTSGGTLVIGGSTIGNITFGSGATYTLSGGTISIVHTATGGKIFTNGKSLPATTFNGSGGAWTLCDTNTFSSISLVGGTLDTGGNTCNWGNYAQTGSGGICTLYLRNSMVNLTDTSGTVWNISTGTTFSSSINAGLSTIKINATSASTRTFAGGGLTYNILDYTLSGSTGSLTLTNSNTFDTINFSDASNARTITFTAGTTTTITDSFNINGTASKLMTIASSTTSAATLSFKSSSFVSCDYLSISYSTATPTGIWYAGTNSTNGGNNSGWTFTAPPKIPRYRIPSSVHINANSSGIVTLEKSSIGTSFTTGLSLSNVTAGANGAPQFSPVIEWMGDGYSTTASVINKLALQGQSVSGSFTYTGRSGDGYIALLNGYNNAAYGSKQWILDGYGNLITNGFITYAGTPSKLPPVNPWIDVTFTNSFTNYGAPYHNVQYMKDAFGNVHLRGAIKGPGGAGSAVAFTLPAGYRANTKYDILVWNNTTLTSQGGYQFPTNGQQTLNNNTTIIIYDGISFLAEA